MSHEDNNRSNDRGAYTPPTDDDLPFNRGGYDARRSAPKNAPPVTLIVSAIVLLALIVAVVLYYRSGLRASTDAPPAVGTPVGPLTIEAPIEAQPVDPEEGVGLYRDAPEIVETDPTFVAPPEVVLPRPAPRPIAPVETEVAPPPARAAAPPVSVPAPAPAKAAPAPAAASAGTSGVQIGAFASTAAADREYAALAGRYPQFARVAEKRVQEVTTSTGTTVYRTTFTGLSRESAQAFCTAIKAGGGDCLVR
ncbi:MAG: SPOR domain-containing protein [Alphaproteobacteria bacterium]|nr:MAG: SPOR domain-containing protein [Alphaproteobacteria bacterium]PZO37366.1 MAG: SPOR domain-containing protein [Alphaproteobacteria bacterium]